MNGHLPCERREATSRVARLLAIFLVLAVTSACASMPPDRFTYNSIEGAKAGVTAAVKAWGDLYTAGRYTDADREKVKKAYLKFEAAVAVAVDLSATATNPEQKKNAMAYINNAAADIMALLRAFDVVK